MGSSRRQSRRNESNRSCCTWPRILLLVIILVVAGVCIWKFVPWEDTINEVLDNVPIPGGGDGGYDDNSSSNGGDNNSDEDNLVNNDRANPLLVMMMMMIIRHKSTNLFNAIRIHRPRAVMACQLFATCAPMRFSMRHCTTECLHSRMVFYSGLIISFNSKPL